MKIISIILTLFTISISLLAHLLPAVALGRDGGLTQTERLDSQRASAPEIVKWTGTIQDDDDCHTTEHKHELEFTRMENGDTYDVIDSPELVKLHHETEKNYLVEIEAERTPRFLFWGGNLIVKKFNVLKEISERISHRDPALSAPRSFYDHGVSDRRGL